MDKIFKPCKTHYVEPPHPQISMFQRACYQKDVRGLIFFRPLGLIRTSGYINIELWGRGGCTG